MLLGSCILQVWNHGSALQPCKCPLCRRQITLLVPSEASSQQAHNAEASAILKKIEAYNRLFGSQSSGLAKVFISFFFFFNVDNSIQFSFGMSCIEPVDIC